MAPLAPEERATPVLPTRVVDPAPLTKLRPRTPGIGLRARLALLVVIAVTIFTAGRVLLSRRGAAEPLLDEARSRAIALTGSLTVPCAMALAVHALERIDRYLDAAARSARGPFGLVDVSMLDHEGHVVAHASVGAYRGGRLGSENASMNAFLKEAAASPDTLWRERSPAEGQHLMDVAVPAVSGIRWGTIVATFDLGDVDARMAEELHTSVAVAGALALALMLAMALGLERLVLRPIRQLRNATVAIEGGDLAARTELRSRDELEQLGTSFNAMASRLEKYTTELERMVAERTSELGRVNDQLRNANQKLKELAVRDPLTGILNRRRFDELLEFEVRRGTRARHPFAMLMVDLDHFKRVNDTYGHPAGDRVLKAIAEHLKAKLRSTDIVARFGGEEFAILLLDTDRTMAYQTALKLCESIRALPIHVDDDDTGIEQVTASIGVATFPHDAATTADIIEAADRALYVAKNSGRDQVVQAERNVRPRS